VASATNALALCLPDTQAHIYCRLQADEQSAQILGQPSKAATKRARKKAARQQSAAAAGDAAAADNTATSMVAATGTAEPQASAGSSSAAPVTAVLLPAAAAASASAAPPVATDIPAAALPAAQQSAAGDWWRCPLSGQVMRDPVLFGGEGHSFERAALEQWLAANPGVDPLSKQLLPPEGGTVVPTHALRNLVQRLHPS
jgi:U-box domain